MSIKYYRVLASYDPKRMSKYDYKIIDINDELKERTIKREIKKNFQSTVTWLKVYDVSEISESECSKYIFRTLTTKPKTN